MKMESIVMLFPYDLTGFQMTEIVIIDHIPWIAI